MKLLRDIRVIPVVLVAVGALAFLKVVGLVIDGGYVFDYQGPPPKRSWAQETLNFPTPRAPDTVEVTGSVPAAKPKPEPDVAKPADTPAEARTAGGTVLFPDQSPPVSASERAVLERLQARRQELETRAREVDIRESLLKAAEKRIEGRVEEMKGVEQRITSATEQKSEADAGRFKALVTMYEGMRPKDAARVFDRLEMPVLIEIASQIAPRKMSDILGLMSSEAAEKLTVELARRASGERSTSAAELPKIEGRPLGRN